LDPLDLIPKYGTDAVRLSLVMGTTPGQDVKLSEAKIEGFRNFTNKLWNISRFILMQIGDAENVQASSARTMADDWIMERLSQVIAGVTKKLETYQFSAAGEELRDFTWNDLADWYLEIAKIEKNKAGILQEILKALLALWHPFMPFVTESLWQQAGFGGQLIIAAWPKVESTPAGVAALAPFEQMRSLITDMRRLRSEQGVEPAVQLEYAIALDPTVLVKMNFGACSEVIRVLARASSVQFVETIPAAWPSLVTNGATIAANTLATVDVAKEKEKIAKELAQLETYSASTEVKLQNEEFLSKAPAKVKEEMERKLAEARAKIEALRLKAKQLG
jgi:valyl-tRNA synthetase